MTVALRPAGFAIGMLIVGAAAAALSAQGGPSFYDLKTTTLLGKPADLSMSIKAG